MSTFAKKVLLCVIGVLAGLASWPFSEVILFYQGYFPSFLIFSVFLGLIFGLFFGIFFSTTEGIFLQDKVKILKGTLTGAIIGMIGGIIGFLAGQFVLFIIGDMFLHSASDFNKIGLPVSRAVSWAILGIFIGMIDGIRSRSGKKIGVGILGGFLGGALGGCVYELLKYSLTNVVIGRIIGLMVFGLLVGFFYGLIEKKLAYGVLRLLNGLYRGKEYLINQKKLRIGVSHKNDFTLSEYRGVEDSHALLYVKKDDVYIKNTSNSSGIKVNDDVVSEQRLKFDDVIKIGEAKFLFKYR